MSFVLLNNFGSRLLIRFSIHEDLPGDHTTLPIHPDIECNESVLSVQKSCLFQTKIADGPSSWVF